MKRKPTSTTRWFVIINPAAGGGRAYRRAPHLRTWLKAHLPAAQITMTTAPGHATELAKQAVAQGFRHLLAVGGDGTCHEIINGVLQQRQIPSTEITLALFPFGTGNDWIRNYGIPRRRTPWLHMLQEGHTTIQDAGRLTFISPQDAQQVSRYFFNVASIGLAAYTVKKSQEQLRPSRLPGRYLLLLFQSLMTYQPPLAEMSFNTQSRQDRFMTVEAGIGAYLGGGLQLLPQAVPDDGQLAVTLARHTSTPSILFNIWRFFNGSIGEHPNVELHQTRQLRMKCLEETPLFVEADGEYLGLAPVAIEIVPAALRFVVPA